MSAMTIGRGMVCWLCFALVATGVYGQGAGEEPKPNEPQDLSAAIKEDYVRKLKAELDASAVQAGKMQAELKRTEAEREALSAELRKLREALEASARERKVAQERGEKQAEEMAARMREMMSAQIRSAQKLAPSETPGREGDLQERLETARKSVEEAARAAAEEAVKRAKQTLDEAARTAEKTAPMRKTLEEAARAAAAEATKRAEQTLDQAKRTAEETATMRKTLEEAARATAAAAMNRAAETLEQAAQKAEREASKLDEGRFGSNKELPHETDQGWMNLLDRAEMPLKQRRRNEEAATRFLPKLESAVTQLRKAGRNEEADQLQAEADRLLGQAREARPEMAPRDRHADGQSPAWGDVERAVGELRREVEQLRREVRDLRQSFERGAGDNESSRQQGRRGPRMDGPAMVGAQKPVKRERF